MGYYWNIVEIAKEIAKDLQRISKLEVPKSTKLARLEFSLAIQK